MQNDHKLNTELEVLDSCLSAIADIKLSYQDGWSNLANQHDIRAVIASLQSLLPNSKADE